MAERHVSSPIPLLDDAELTDELAEALRPRRERLGYLGAFFRAAAHQPEALGAFNAFTESLKLALPEELTEIVALGVAARVRNRYERNQHEQLARRQGHGDAWILAAEQRAGHTAAELDTAEQRAVARLAEAALRETGHGVDDELGEVVRLLGPADAMAVLLLIGRYVAHATVANALRLDPPVSSVVDDRDEP